MLGMREMLADGKLIAGGDASMAVMSLTVFLRLRRPRPALQLDFSMRACCSFCFLARMCLRDSKDNCFW